MQQSVASIGIPALPDAAAAFAAQIPLAAIPTPDQTAVDLAAHMPHIPLPSASTDVAAAAMLPGGGMQPAFGLPNAGAIQPHLLALIAQQQQQQQQSVDNFVSENVEA